MNAADGFRLLSRHDLAEPLARTLRMPTDPPPTPLTDPATDLRDFGFMPLDVVRLRDSELAMGSDAEVFRVAVLSWCVGWHQVPAASLPDDDAALARLLQYGRDIKGWKRMRESGGLRGWVKCSDGRLYHPVVAEKANEAWQAKLAQRARTEAARAAAAAKRQHDERGQRHHHPQSLSQASVTDSVAGSKGQLREGTGKGQGQRESTPLPPPGVSSPTSPATTAALTHRVDGVNQTRVRHALAKGSLLELVSAFGANVEGPRAAEWERDCDGLQLGVVATIFAWRRKDRESIREPSGFRPWRARWREMQRDERDELLDLLKDYGIELPEQP